MSAKREYELYISRQDIIKRGSELASIEKKIKSLEMKLEKKNDKVIQSNINIDVEAIHLKEEIEIFM